MKTQAALTALVPLLGLLVAACISEPVPPRQPSLFDPHAPTVAAATPPAGGM